MSQDRHGLQILGRDECMRLLAHHPTHVGRIGFIDGGRPMVLPVNYRLVEGRTAFRTGLGSKVAAVRTGVAVAFEVDDVDLRWREGYSVVVRGQAQEVPMSPDWARLDEALPASWAGKDKPIIVTVAIDEVSGRRLL